MRDAARGAALPADSSAEHALFTHVAQVKEHSVPGERAQLVELVLNYVPEHMQNRG